MRLWLTNHSVRSILMIRSKIKVQEMGDGIIVSVVMVGMGGKEYFVNCFSIWSLNLVVGAKLDNLLVWGRFCIYIKVFTINKRN